MASRDATKLEKQALIERIEASREQLAGDVACVVEAVDVPSRIRRSIASSPLKFAAGAAVAGLAGSALLRRPLRTARGVGQLRKLLGPAAMFGLDLALRRLNRADRRPGTPGPDPARKPSAAERVARAIAAAFK